MADAELKITIEDDQAPGSQGQGSPIRPLAGQPTVGPTLADLFRSASANQPPAKAVTPPSTAAAQATQSPAPKKSSVTAPSKRLSIEDLGEMFGIDLSSSKSPSSITPVPSAPINATASRPYGPGGGSSPPQGGGSSAGSGGPSNLAAQMQAAIDILTAGSKTILSTATLAHSMVSRPTPAPTPSPQPQPAGPKQPGPGPQPQPQQSGGAGLQVAVNALNISANDLSQSARMLTASAQQMIAAAGMLIASTAGQNQPQPNQINPNQNQPQPPKPNQPAKQNQQSVMGMIDFGIQVAKTAGVMILMNKAIMGTINAFNEAAERSAKWGGASATAKAEGDARLEIRQIQNSQRMDEPASEWIKMQNEVALVLEDIWSTLVESGLEHFQPLIKSIADMAEWVRRWVNGDLTKYLNEVKMVFHTIAAWLAFPWDEEGRNKHIEDMRKALMKHEEDKKAKKAVDEKDPLGVLYNAIFTAVPAAIPRAGMAPFPFFVPGV